MSRRPPHFLPDDTDYLLGWDLDEFLEEHEHTPEDAPGFQPFSVSKPANTRQMTKDE